MIGWTRAEPEGLYPGRGEGGDRSDGLLEVTGHLASPLFFFSQAEITPRVSLVPVTVKSPGAPNDFSSLLQTQQKISRRGFNDKLCNGKMPHFAHVCRCSEYKKKKKSSLFYEQSHSLESFKQHM